MSLSRLLCACLAFLLVGWSAAKVIVIDVGLPLHKFGPNVTTADVGDEIEFHFQNSKHSVVRAAFGQPCWPYNTLTDESGPGFFSGFHEHEPGKGDIPTWRLRVNDSSPIFFYCSAPDSCDKSQMIGVINPTPEFSFQKQLSNINEKMTVLQPGDPAPPEGSSASSPTSPASPAAPPGKGLHLPLPAIIGIAVGSFAILALAAALFFFVGRSKSLKDEAERREATVTRQTFPPSPRYETPMSPSLYTDNGSGLPGYEKVGAPEYRAYSYPRVGPDEAAFLRNSTVSPGSEIAGGVGYAHSGQVGTPLGSPGAGDGGVVELDGGGGRYTR
ncbi:hypothetical protein CC80DRAFT_547914 [Byssothecium circinans]|uniref:Cupredoxin n=1 Tax=Byssothecium circinans TaxID=147558 RepID=A0A6A5U2G8_9PLEO|nr:hypothetical protein CC80DRAFT_547914 [Byssothecium circinans]